MPQITRITSESLQATVRRLLPSQQGFGVDLEAQNVIVPIVDLTPTAEGSQLQQNLAEALSYGNVNEYSVTGGTTSDIQTTPGFWRVYGTSTIIADSTTFRQNALLLERSGVQKIFWKHLIGTGAINNEAVVIDYDFITFLDTGDKLVASAAPSGGVLAGSTRQIATKNGEIRTPPEFTFE